MNTYPLTHINKDQEQRIIKQILKKNGYKQSIIHHKHKNKAHENLTQEQHRTEKQK
jgi:hypothetical protein